VSDSTTPTHVAVNDTGTLSYPGEAPFDPPERYPELPKQIWHVDPTNRVYAGVRETLRLLGRDAGRFGTERWSPLSGIVRPGDHVLIKPNMVRHFHGNGLGLEALVTHASVVRALLDYVIIALAGEGEITIGDSPLQYADFRETLAATGLERVIDEAASYAGVPVTTVDFRKERSEKRDGLIVSRLPNNGDPRGYRTVDVGPRSAFAGKPERVTRRFRVTQYDPVRMRGAHDAEHHAYLFPATVLSAGVVINVPKLKTHRKAGITAAMKNLVGINGSKDWLPHHTAGAKSEGGDEYLHSSRRKRVIAYLRDRIEGRRSARARRWIHLVERGVKASGRVVRFPDPYWEGSWHGNDTVWRMVHDLHTVLFHADAKGVIRDTPQRRYFALVDAIVAGEGDGPMRPSPRPSGLLIAGENPAAVDLVCCRLMGFDERRIPLLSHTIGRSATPSVPSAGSISIVTNEGRWKRLFELPRDQTLAFTPPDGWAGVVELRP